MLYNQKNIYVRSPLRVSFIGGGTDFPEFYKKKEGHVVSAAVPLYVYVSMKDMFDANIRAHHAEIETEPISSRIRHEYIRTALEHFGLFRGIEVVITSDIMTTGSGLGASSAIMSALVFACSNLQDKPLERSGGMAEKIFQLEQEAGVVGGKQDQYATLFGGLNSIAFSEKEVKVNPISISQEVKKAFQDRGILIFTNLARKSVSIQTRLKENIKKNKHYRYLEEILALSHEFKNILQSPTPDLDELGKILHQGWLLKQKTNQAVSNPYIAQLYDWLRSRGVIGGKILGAGGGGFFFAYCKDGDTRDKLMYQLYPNFIGIKFTICDKGSEVLWKNF